MSVFKTEKILRADAKLIPGIADEIAADFKSDLFEVNVQNFVSGGADISLSKGGLFKAVLGLKSALKITMLPTSGGISFTAGVGIFGQQVIPTIISWCFFWPVLVTQISGMIKQAKLDDRALAVAERYIASHTDGAASMPNGGMPKAKFCSACGNPLASESAFCVHCGAKVAR